MYRFGFVVIVMAVACGGDDGGPLSASEARDLCADICAHESECGNLADGETVASCTTDCANDLGGGGYRQDVFEDAAACVSAQACAAEDADCLSCAPTSAHEAYETRCREKATECGATSGVDEICETTYSSETGDGFVCIFTPAVMDALRACFDQGCEMIETCFNSVATQYGIDL